MKRFRNYRLVCACINLGAALVRLVAALVNMASNYRLHDGAEMDAPLRA